MPKSSSMRKLIFLYCVPFSLLLQDWAAFVFVVSRLSSLRLRPFLVNLVLLTSLYVQFIFSSISEIHWYNVQNTLHSMFHSFSHYLQQCFFALTSVQAVTQDGFGCIRCPDSISDDGRCQCPTGSILGEWLMTGLITGNICMNNSFAILSMQKWIKNAVSSGARCPWEPFGWSKVWAV